MTALSEGLQESHFCLMSGIEDLQTEMTAFFNADKPTEEQIASVEDAVDWLIDHLAKYRDEIGDEFSAPEEDADSELTMTTTQLDCLEPGGLMMQAETCELYSSKGKIAEGTFDQVGSILKHELKDGDYVIVGPSLWFECARKKGIVGPLEGGIQANLPPHVISEMRRNRLGAR
jgi:hypothetical protein